MPHEEPKTCKFRGNRLVCDTRTFLRAMDIKHQHPDDVEIDFSLFDQAAFSDDDLDRMYMDYANNIESCIKGFMTKTRAIEGVEGVNIDFGKDIVEIEISDKDKFLNSIREAMNGVGAFHARDNKEFIKGTYPGNKNKVIETHIGWLGYIPEIYGTTSIDRCIESR